VSQLQSDIAATGAEDSDYQVSWYRRHRREQGWVEAFQGLSVQAAATWAAAAAQKQERLEQSESATDLDMGTGSLFGQSWDDAEE
jgi:hypothetical protein